MNVSIPLGHPMNTDNDYHDMFCEYCHIRCAIFVREEKPYNAEYQARKPLAQFLTPLVWGVT